VSDALGLVCPGGSGAVVWIEGEIDVCVADRLQELLLQLMRAHGPRLLLDLSAVSFMDCAGLGALVLTRRHAEVCGWSMHLIAASAMVRKIIMLTGAEDALPVRHQSGNCSGGTSSPPEEQKYCPVGPSLIHRTFPLSGPDRPPTTKPPDLGMWPTGSRGSMR
jgi:anti-anti-sigma factor